MQKTLILLMIAIFMLTSNVFADIHISENLGDDADDTMNWIPDSGDVYIDATVHVVDDIYDELTIAPGMKVYFSGDYSLIIDGGATLTASGTEANPIHFTSVDSAAGDWDQIEFNGDAGGIANYAKGSFNYCVFSFGGDFYTTHSAEEDPKSWTVC